MPLIKTLEEIQATLPKLVSKLSTYSLLPNWERVEYKYVVPVIGPVLYEALVTAYNADTLDAEETELVKKLRLIIAANGFKDELGLQFLTLTDSGAQRLQNGNTERLYNWEVQKLETTLINTAIDGVEITLAYLFDNKALFPEWTGSEQYSKINALLIKTGTEFSNDNYTLYQPQRSFFIMRSIIYDVQRLFIEETTGAALLAYLKDAATPTAAEKECIALLKKALAFFSVAKACNHFSVSFTDGGFTILGEKNSNALDNQSNQPTDLQLLDKKIKACMEEGDSYLELSRNKLVALYNDAGATVQYKAALLAGPLAGYTQPSDRTSGNETRNIYALP